jgi:hypothetical protein
MLAGTTDGTLAATFRLPSSTVQACTFHRIWFLFFLFGLRVARIVRSLVQALLCHDSFDLWLTTFDVAVSDGHDSSSDLSA